MAYDTTFYDLYEAYLREPLVRQAHDRVLAIARMHPALNRVVDLGCGRSKEYLHYAHPALYSGFDRNEPSAYYNADYRDPAPGMFPSWATGFVSLFSSEITAPYVQNYALYERLFEENPGVKAGLVSGFFYASHRNTNPIEETGGIVSYQTLEAIEEVISPVFAEMRITLSVPSAMFGPDVYEVWKLLEKRAPLEEGRQR